MSASSITHDVENGGIPVHPTSTSGGVHDTAVRDTAPTDTSSLINGLKEGWACKIMQKNPTLVKDIHGRLALTDQLDIGPPIKAHYGDGDGGHGDGDGDGDDDGGHSLGDGDVDGGHGGHGDGDHGVGGHGGDGDDGHGDGGHGDGHSDSGDCLP